MFTKKRTGGAVVAAWSVVVAVPTAFGQCLELEKCVASDAASGDWFGFSAAIDGDVMVAGAYGEDDLGSESGAVYVYRFDGSSWQEEEKLTAFDGVAGDHFGFSVAVEGDVLAVGARRLEVAGQARAGGVYVYRYNGSSWAFEQKLTASNADPNDEFGYAVNLSGSALIVGAPFADTAASDAGAAYVFRRNIFNWSEEAELNASDGGSTDYFGFSVDVDGSHAVVGAYLDNNDNGTDAGAAYVYEFLNPQWTNEQKLLSSDGASFDYVGVSVSISGDAILAGAHGDDDMGSGAGAGYVFRQNAGVWAEEGKLIPSSGNQGDQWGRAVAIDGGVSILGAHLDDLPQANKGSALVYRECNGLWNEDLQVAASDGVGEDRFGYAVAVSGDRAVGGAWSNGAGDSGSAYVYGVAEIELMVEPLLVTPGTTVTFTTFCGTPGNRVLFTVVDPVFLTLLIFPYASDHRLTLPVNVNNVDFPAVLTFQSFEVGSCGKLVGSNTVDVAFEP